MKNLVTTSLTVMAISLSGCTTPSANKSEYKGRIIEFKSDASGFDTRTFFYEGTHEVIAFDAQFTPELAEKSIQHLRTYTQKPISWLVITHPNPDKFNGASVFKAHGAKIIASKSTAANIPASHAYKEYYFVEIAKMFKKGQYPTPVPVDHTFEKNTELTLKGGQRIELRELSEPGVSTNQTVAFLKSINALFVGDLVHTNAHAWLEGGIVAGQPTPTIAGWIADLKELSSLYPLDAKVYGGRGIAIDLKTAVHQQINYLNRAVEIVDSELTQAKTKTIDSKNLAFVFQKSFPNYDLNYMIEYGAYGLVQARSAALKK